MPRRPTDNVGGRRLRGLIEEAMDRHDLQLTAVAEAAGIDRGHFTNFMRGGKGLSRRKLLSLADVLRIPRNKVLEAAGFSELAASSISPGVVTFVRSKGETRLRVIFGLWIP